MNHLHIVHSVCQSQDKLHHIVRNYEETCTSPASISSFPDRQEGGIASPDTAAPGTTEPYPRKYDKEGQDGVGSKNNQEVDRSILYNRHNKYRNLTHSAEGPTPNDRNEFRSSCKVCMLACSRHRLRERKDHTI